MSFTIFVQGEPVVASLVGHQQLGFGQRMRGPGNLTIVLPDAVLLELLRDSYERYVEETSDMWEEPDPDDLLEVAGHPPWGDVIRDSILLEYVLRESLTFEFLEAVASSSDPAWIIENFAEISRFEGGVRVLCVAAHCPKSSIREAAR